MESTKRHTSRELETMDRGPKGHTQQCWSEANWFITVAMVANSMGKKEKSKRNLMPMRSDERLAQKIATNILSDYPVDSILDIGCGDGVVSKHLPSNTSYLGLDINEACIYEKSENNPLIRYINPEAIPDLVSSEGPWDMTLLFDVLEHTTDFTGLFKLALHSSNKYIAVSLPNELFILDRLRMLAGKELNAHSLDLVNQPDGFKHQYIINIEKAKSILEKIGIQEGFQLENEFVRPIIPKNRLIRPLAHFVQLISNDQLWSQGSVFIFSKANT